MLNADIIAALERLAPLHLAADWDNVGLLIGSRTAATTRIMLTIDLTAAVLREAIEAGAQMILAYHPPIFHPLKTVTDDSPHSRIVHDALRAGVAVYSPHTALDAADGGLNDWLCAALGNGDIRSIEPFAELPETQTHKIITYLPADAVDAVRNALASAGAGRIGAYSLCSYEIPGTGTFLGDDSTNPAVGTRGELNRVKEVRLEMVCSSASLALAIESLRQFHPYEEPPIEILRFEPRPQRRVGSGRRIVLDQPLTLRAVIDRIKKHLGLRNVQVATTADGPSRVTHVGVCAGAGGSLLDAAITQQCQVFITGELRHHDVLKAVARGCSVILAGHTNTERPYLKPLGKRLRSILDDVDVLISRRDADPLRIA